MRKSRPDETLERGLRQERHHDGLPDHAATTGDPWANVTTTLGVVNTAGAEASDDNCRLYYSTNELGNHNIRMAVREP